MLTTIAFDGTWPEQQRAALKPGTKMPGGGTQNELSHYF